MHTVAQTYVADYIHTVTNIAMTNLELEWTSSRSWLAAYFRPLSETKHKACQEYLVQQHEEISTAQ